MKTGLKRSQRRKSRLQGRGRKKKVQKKFRIWKKGLRALCEFEHQARPKSIKKKKGGEGQGKAGPEETV